MKKSSKFQFLGLFPLFFIGWIIFSCENNSEKISEENQKEITEKITFNEKEFLSLGDSISNHLQSILLKNVAQSIEKGGTEYAVDFCNIHAIPLTDSISQLHQVVIQRITDKNRNPENGLQTKMDEVAWEKMQENPHSFLEQEENQTYFYKPIKIGMETCIKCHGGKEDISEKTKNILNKKYPEDKALHYAIGDLRGMWKIKM